MDLDEYSVLFLIKQRHAEMLADARRWAALREAAERGRPLRVTVGTVLIRVGAWLLREEYTPRPT